MTSSLKPVPSLHKKLMLDQSPCRDTEIAVRFTSNAKLAEPPDNLIREGSVLVGVELHEAAPFLVAEVSPRDHHEPFSVECLDDSTVLSFDGIKQPIVEWALDYGITPSIIIGRLERGMSIADAITTPMLVGHAGQRLPIYSRKQTHTACRSTRSPNRKRAFRIYTHNGMTLSIAEWAEVTGLPLGTLRNRMDADWDIERALTTPHGGTGPKVPGVVSDLPASKGTGGGNSAQTTPNLTFSGNDP